MNKHLHLLLFTAIFFFVAGCKEESITAVTPPPTGKDPNTAEVVSIDRFSSSPAGKLYIRTTTNGMPAVNAAVNFDVAPFITHGFGPSGQSVRYYNFDVQLSTPAPIYVLFYEGESTPVPNQLNIVNVIPGEVGYNDLWVMQKVTVPKSYVANTVTSLAEITAEKFVIVSLPAIVNCPIVPSGSTAAKRIGGGSTALSKGWYKGKIVTYFTFEEKAIAPTVSGMVPLSPIYVTFNTNPDKPGGGPPSGFVVEAGTTKTHNVLATIPTSTGYSPLWSVNVYDNAQFSSVNSLATAQAATLIAPNVMKVNCPVFEVP